MTAKPTRFQYFLANNWGIFIWQWGWPIITTFCAFASLGLPSSSMRIPSFSALIAILIFAALAFALGFFLAVISGWFLLGPYFYARGITNGAPYEPGDFVRILAGPYRDTIAPIYSKCGDFAVRVDLGTDAKQRSADVFCWYQVIRAETDEQNFGPKADLYGSKDE